MHLESDDDAPQEAVAEDMPRERLKNVNVCTSIL